MERKWLILYGLALFFVVLVVLILMNKTVDILPIIGRKRQQSRVAAKGKAYWTNTLANPVLKVTKAELPEGFMPERYTMLVDILWGNSRSLGNDSPYRHILHKGSDDLQTLVESNFFKRESNNLVSCPLPSGYKMPPNGLPKRMNPGIFADPYLNDILIFIDTEYDNKLIRESVRIPDIPLEIPFRLGLIVQNNTLEVYLNCKLELTKLLKGRPIQVEPEWYGLAGKAPFAGQIQSLKLWPFPLNVLELDTQCPMPIEFINKQLPCLSVTSQSIDQDLTKAPPNKEEPQTMSYGNSLSVCKST